MSDLGGKLSQKQERFVEHYALCGNAAEAARLAGYSAKTARQIATENLSKPSVKQALEARREVYRADLAVTKDQVVAGLLSAIEIGRKQENPNVIISGLVQVAKLCGFYEPEKVNLTLSANGKLLSTKFAAMSDDELMAIIAKGG